MQLVSILIALIVVSCAPTVTQQAPQSHSLYIPLAMKPEPNIKRGIAASGNGGVESIRQTNATWYYNWWYLPSPNVPESAIFVPQICTPAPRSWCAAFPVGIPPSEYLTGINEPNLIWQGETCPQDYVETWAMIVEYYGDRKLISPGVGYAGTLNCKRPDGTIANRIDGITWLRDFYRFYSARYGDPKFAGLAFHCYPMPESPCSDAIAVAKEYIALADEFGVSEVWVTEFDAGKMGGQDIERARRWIEYFNSESRIVRYAYYQDWAQGFSNSALVDANGKLTQYGIMYMQK